MNILIKTRCNNSKTYTHTSTVHHWKRPHHTHHILTTKQHWPKEHVEGWPNSFFDLTVDEKQLCSYLAWLCIPGTLWWPMCRHSSPCVLGMFSRNSRQCRLYMFFFWVALSTTNILHFSMHFSTHFQTCYESCRLLVAFYIFEAWNATTIRNYLQTYTIDKGVYFARK